MSENNINAYCSICGNGYHMCGSCMEQIKIKPWRSIVDTIEHYKIYLAIHGYTVTNNKEQARKELQKCDLTGLESFNPEIKSVISEIMETTERVKTSSRKRKEYTEAEVENKENGISE